MLFSCTLACMIFRAFLSLYLLDIPIDGIPTSVLKSFVGATKAPTSQERTGSLCSAEGTGMARLDDRMSRFVDGRSLLLSGPAPQKEYNTLLIGIQLIDDFVGEFLPSLFSMTVGLPSANGQHGIDKQYTLLGPTFEISIFRCFNDNVLNGLPEYILQGGWRTDTWLDRKRQPVPLTGSMIRILSNNDNFHLVKRA